MKPAALALLAMTAVTIPMASAAEVSQGVIFGAGVRIERAALRCGVTYWSCSWKLGTRSGSCPTTPPANKTAAAQKCMCGSVTGQKIGISFGCE